jgi:transcriptional regulator with XRE-family HTH domain
MLGTLIRRERERLGLSQVRLARLVGCTPKTIWRLEHDPGLRPHVRIKRRLAMALDLPLETVEEAIRRQPRADTEQPPAA